MKKKCIIGRNWSSTAKLLAVAGIGCIGLTPVANAQSIFVDLLTSGSAPTTTTIAAPTGYGYSGAAPVAGTTWNTVGKSTTVPNNTVVGSTVNVYSGLALVDSGGTSLSSTLSISYYSAHSTGTRTEPSGGSGENTIQPGGVMQDAWRNYYNGSGNYFTFTISGLANSTPFDLYFEGGADTTQPGQGAGLALAAGNVLGANASSASTANDVANFNGDYASLFDSSDSGSTYQLMTEGTTWEVLHGQSDASGNFSFLLNGSGSAAYLNGFQLVAAPVPEPASATLLLGGMGMLVGAWRRRKNRA